MASGYTESVAEVWQRLDRLRPYLKSRDIELLLDYKDSNEKELTQCKEDMDCIKLILQTMNPGFTTESSLQNLVKLSLPNVTSDTVKEIYHIAMLNKILTLAVKDGLDKSKNGTKIPIPRDKNSTPSFYNIIKEVKKKNIDVEKDLVRATKLWLWVKKQSETSATVPSTPSESTMLKSGSPKKKTAVAKAKGSSTPAPIQPPNQSNDGVKQSPSFQCHLLLSTHDASANISSPEYKKLTALEDKLKYILNELQGYQRNQPQTTTAARKSPQKPSETCQTETQDAGVKTTAKRKEKKSRKSPESPVDIPSPTDSSKSHEQPVNDDVSHKTSAKDSLKSTQTIDSCLSWKNCNSENSSNKNLSASCNGKQLTDQQLSQPSQLPAIDPAEDRNDNNSIDDAAASVFAEENKDLQSIEMLYKNVLRDQNSSSDETQVSPNSEYRPVIKGRDPAILAKRASFPFELGQMAPQLPLMNRKPTPKGRLRIRMGSAPAARRTSVTIQHEQITLLPDRCTEPIPKVDRVARSLISSPKYSTMPARSDGEWRLQNMDPEKASLEELLHGDDVADVPEESGIRSYLDYRAPLSIDDGRFSRSSVMSADSVNNIIWTISSKLDPGQWKELFKELMKETTNPTQITEDICGIMGKYQDDVRQGVKSLELWRQTNGSFPIDVLLHSLTDIRRRDIFNAVKKQVFRLSQPLTI